MLKQYEQTLMDIEDILGSGVTTNDQLDKLGYSIFKNDYLGTYSSDKMPKYIKNNQCFILNRSSKIISVFSVESRFNSSSLGSGTLSKYVQSRS